MIREYKNQKIYRDFIIVKVLSIISLILAFVTLFNFIFFEYIIEKWAFESAHIVFMTMLICIPLVLVICSCKAKPTKKVEETNTNNDIANLIATIVISFLDIILVICLSFTGLIFGNMQTAYLAAYLLGYSFISHIFSYISAFILIHALSLIKKEWKLNPPQYYIIEQLKIKEQRELTSQENSLKKCNSLLEKSGIRFFIKYLKQIQRLPLKDIIIEENYSAKEQKERINAVKAIVDLKMVNLALNQILQNYSSALKSEEIKTVSDLLKEFKKEDETL